MSSHSRHFISSRPQVQAGNTTGAIGEGPNAPQFPRRAHARPVNIPERRLWSSHGRHKFFIHDSSGSSQGSSTKSSSTTSEGRLHTASPYGSFFVDDMDIDNPADSHSSSQGGGWTTRRGTTAANLNRVVYHQTSARRPPPSSQNDDLYRQRSPIRVAPGGLFQTTTEPTCFGMPGALPTPSRSVPRESQSNQPTPWNREYRNHSNSPHNSQARLPRVPAVTGTSQLPGSSLSNPDRQQSRGVTRTTWRK